MIRTLICSACSFALSFNTFAGNGSPKPVSPFSPDFFALVRKIDSSLALSEIQSSRTRKICSCQILNLQSSNYKHNNVAVFAEKTSQGNYSAASRIATVVIEKEKRHLRHAFYDRLQVINRFSENTDCRSLFSKLKGADHSLVMYDILDADVRK
ncbi:MAG TPA: hypothetical protein VMH01_07205 [Puia sp.]|nr:hypothetical protein [Puia sp.]